MTFFVISILIGCLSVMNVQGRRGKWPPGMPVTRPRLVAVGGTFEGSRGRPSDAYVIQERLVATADGGTGPEAGHVAAALALAAVIAGRPQHGARASRTWTTTSRPRIARCATPRYATRPCRIWPAPWT